MDVFNRKGKTNGFLIVFIDLSSSTFKDEDVKEQNYDNDFQSEAKNHRFFNGFVMILIWDDFNTKW